MDRALAHIEKVHNIRPIDGADKIEQVNVLGWNLVAKKGEFQEDELCVYIEIDSRVNKDNEYFSFLESRKYKVKSIKLRGVVSQGLACPLSILPKGNYKIGDDVTEILKITKIEEDYQPPVQDSLAKLNKSKKKLMKNPVIKYFMRYEWFRNIMLKLFVPQRKKSGFPSWVSKTDETRIQNIPEILNNKNPFQVTEKLDGTSTTFTLKRIGKNKFEFLVCSRNMIVGGGTSKKKAKLYYDTNVYTEMAEKYNAREVLENIVGDNEYIALQGETIGETIQGNKYNLVGRDFYAFNLVTPNGKIDSTKAADMLKPFGIKWVPIIQEDYILPDTIEELMQFSTGDSELYKTLREGYVFRDKNNEHSFKCVSNEFLLKHGL